jgi:hypothetical protein
MDSPLAAGRAARRPQQQTADRAEPTSPAVKSAHVPTQPVPLAGVPRPRLSVTDTRSGVLRTRVAGPERRSPIETR